MPASVNEFSLNLPSGRLFRIPNTYASEGFPTHFARRTRSHFPLVTRFCLGTYNLLAVPTLGVGINFFVNKDATLGCFGTKNHKGRFPLKGVTPLAFSTLPEQRWLLLADATEYSRSTGIQVPANQCLQLKPGKYEVHWRQADLPAELNPEEAYVLTEVNRIGDCPPSTRKKLFLPATGEPQGLTLPELAAWLVPYFKDYNTFLNWLISSPHLKFCATTSEGVGVLWPAGKPSSVPHQSFQTAFSWHSGPWPFIQQALRYDNLHKTYKEAIHAVLQDIIKNPPAHWRKPEASLTSAKTLLKALH